MKNPVLIIFISLASTVAVAQETYKCKTPAGMVYQDRPCAGVRYAPEPPAGPATAPAAAPGAPASDMERSKAYLASREKERRIHDLKEQIARTEESIAAGQQARDAEISYLQARSARANNNLAGANLEQALATEMQAVNSRYATDISVKQDRLKQLRDELAQVK
jgi:hypothetical protein